MSRVLAGRYELFDRIGEGGMSVVYKARDKMLNRYVAIKILKPEFINDPKFIDSFRRESQNAANLSQHPNIVNIYDVGKEKNIHYIVMELVEGCALSDLIKKEPHGMAYPKVIAISKQIASALAFAHSNHIIHRDVKPHNVMITPNGTAKITDFGIAKAVNSATIRDTTDGIVGSVHYFSPEQARGGYVDEKSDIYSLGIVMYEMLTGQVPFDGENPVTIALQHINNKMIEPSKLVDGFPPALEKIIMKCCDKHPINRYSSAGELIESLNNLQYIASTVREDFLIPPRGGRPAQDVRVGMPIAETDLIGGEDDLGPAGSRSVNARRRREAQKKNQKKKKMMIIIGAIAAALILGIIGAVILFGGEEIEAPGLTGMTLEQAEALAAENDIKIRVGEEVISEEVDKGLIVSQDPEKGTIIKTGSTITVNISKGLGEGSVPNLSGKMKDDLKDYLKAAGFELGKVTTEASDKPEGTVISQNPAPGSKLEKGSTIDVVVSDGSLALVAVPNVVGQNESAATSTIANAGLRYNVIKRAAESSEASYNVGQVMSQDIAGNTMVKKGTTVTLYVCSKKYQPAPPVEEND